MSETELRSSVLFVCMGNICRSPVAEEVFRTLLSRRGLEERIRIDSAGVTDWHTGEEPDARMRAAATGRGYVLRSCARAVTARDLDEFALVIAMDRDNLADLRRLVPSGREYSHVRLMSDFLQGRRPLDVPDPYYGGAQGFETVIDLVEQACPLILDHLLARDEWHRGRRSRP